MRRRCGTFDATFLWVKLGSPAPASTQSASQSFIRHFVVAFYVLTMSRRPIVASSSVAASSSNSNDKKFIKCDKIDDITTRNGSVYLIASSMQEEDWH